MEPNLENTVDGKQCIVQFDKFGRGNNGGVSRCIVMVEEHFFLCACCPELANAVPITPAAFLYPKFHAGYDPCGLLRCLLLQLSCAHSISGLPIRDHGLLFCSSHFRGTWAWLIKNRRATMFKLI